MTGWLPLAGASFLSQNQVRLDRADTRLLYGSCQTQYSSGLGATESPMPALPLSGQLGPCIGSHLWGRSPQCCPWSTALEDGRDGNVLYPCGSLSRHHHSLPPHHHHHNHLLVTPPLHRICHTITPTPGVAMPLRVLPHSISRLFPSMSSGLLWTWYDLVSIKLCQTRDGQSWSEWNLPPSTAS